MVSFASIVTAAAIATLPLTQAVFEECAEAPAMPEDRRNDTSKLKVATFNAEFLFLKDESHSLSCPGADCSWTTTAEAELHVLQIANVLHALDADIVQMNEVEDCGALDAVITALTALGDDSYKPYLVRGTDTYTGQNAALLTRVDPVADLQRTETRVSTPVSGSVCPGTAYADTQGVSKHFYTSFNVTGFSSPITLVGAHFLANPSSTYRCFDREGQATLLAEIANVSVAAGYHTIVTGDLNDWSATVPDKNNNLPISGVMEILTGDDFVQVASAVPQADRYTEWWDEDEDCVFQDTEVSSLDHMLVSKSLAAGITNVSFNHDLFNSSCSGYNSDHYPLSIVLTAV